MSIIDDLKNLKNGNVKEINPADAADFTKDLDAKYIELLKSEQIKMKKFNAFRNEFKLGELVNKINYLVMCYNTAEGDYNKNFLLKDIKAKAAILLQKIEKWSV